MRIRICFLVALFITVSGSSFGATTRPPNIILILADDLGWGDIGVFHQNARRAAGSPAISTPNLDRLAAGGCRFTNQYAAAPVCAPSRASLLLGVTQGHANVRDNQFDKALENNHTIASVLREGGYATGAIGKWGLQGRPEGGSPNWPAHPLRRGFDYFYGYMRHRDGHVHYPKEGPGPYAPYLPAPPSGQDRSEDSPGPGREVWENDREVSAGLDKCYTTDLFVARAKQWIVDQTRLSRNKPFFLYLALDTPHATLEVPSQAYPAGSGLAGGLQWLGQPGHMINTASGKIDSWIHPDFRAANLPADAKAGWPEVYQRYATMVRRIDDGIGDLVALLADLGIEEETLVIVTSDNGPSLESYLPVAYSPQFFGSFGPFDGVKRDCWEGGLRVPTIVSWPGHVLAGSEIDEPTGLWDWLPTCAELAGLLPPARADGISLAAMLTGGADRRAPARSLYFEYASPGARTPAYPEFEPERRDRLRNQMQAVRRDHLMAIRYDVRDAGDDFEIYDVVRDPKQTVNLGSGKSGAGLQHLFKAVALQSRRPNPSAPRPYDSEPMPALVGPRSKPGVEWSAFVGEFPWVPDFSGLSPKSTGIGVRPSTDVPPTGECSGFSFRGTIEVPETGEYTFYLSGVTGAVLRIHQAVVLDQDSRFPRESTKEATVRLAAGCHPFVLSVVTGVEPKSGLVFEWKDPRGVRRLVPGSAFTQPGIE